MKGGKETKWEFCLRASFTVETALIMPIVIFTVFMSVYITAHIHNRAYLTARAAEQAISGRERETPAFFAGGEIIVSGKDSKTERVVSGEAGTFYYTGSQLWMIKVKETYKKYRPVEMIRVKRAAEKLTGGE